MPVTLKACRHRSEGVGPGSAAAGAEAAAEQPPGAKAASAVGQPLGRASAQGTARASAPLAEAAMKRLRLPSKSARRRTGSKAPFCLNTQERSAARTHGFMRNCMPSKDVQLPCFMSVSHSLIFKDLADIIQLGTWGWVVFLGIYREIHRKPQAQVIPQSTTSKK